MVTLSILLALVGAPMWSKAYDRATHNDSAYAIVYDTLEDAYIVTGHTDNGPLGGTDVLVVKLNAYDGSLVWSKIYGVPSGYTYDDFGRSIIVDYGDTDYYAVAGYTVNTQESSPNTDIIVLKIRASDGKLIWGNHYTGQYFNGQFVSLDAYAYSIAKDGGDYLVAGNVHPGPTGGVSDAMAMSVNRTTGVANWAWAYGKILNGGTAFGNEYFYSIIEDSSTLPCSSFVAAGKTVINEMQVTDILVFKGKKIDGASVPATKYLYDYMPPLGAGHSECAYSIKNDNVPGYILTGDLDSQIVVMKLLPNLLPGWGGKYRTYSIPVRVNSRCIEPTSDGNYVLIGTTSPGIPGLFDLLITKINPAGAVVWSKVLTGCPGLTWMNLDDHGQSIVEGPTGFYAGAGYTNWPANWGTTNLLVTKTDQNGYIPCSSSDTCLKNIELQVDSPQIYVDTAIADYVLKMSPSPIVDSPVILHDTLVCRGGVGTEEEGSCDRGIYEIHNIPNPYIKKTNIYYTLNVSCNVEIAVYNLGGQLVRTLVNRWERKGAYSVMWDGRDVNSAKLPSGIYFYTIKIDKNTVTKKMTMIK